MNISYSNREALKSVIKPKKYLQVKSINDIPDEIIKDIKLISLPGSKSQPFGSYINRISDYFADIDVIQMYSDYGSKLEVGIKTAKLIQKIVKDIISESNHYFSEFKAGIDERYYFDYGELSGGVYYMNKNVLKKSEELYLQNLLSLNEIKIIRKISKKNILNGIDYDIIFNLFRKYFIIRWSSEEILNGKKELLGNKIILLSEAILQRSAIKIDMIVINKGGKFIEVTNFIALGIEHRRKFIPINVDPEDLTPEALPLEIEKLYYSNYFYKPFKVVKRSFAFLKFLYNNWEKSNFDKVKYLIRNINLEYVEIILSRYIEILQSTINILYTINSEIDTIILLLQRANLTKKLHSSINQRLDLLKEPLSNVLEIDDKNLELIMIMIDKCRKVNNKDEKIECLELLSQTFKEIINFWTIAYFDQMGLNPPPYIVLPEKLSYVNDINDIIREPWDSPGNPLKLQGGFIKNIFRSVANVYRKNFCNNKSRPLLPGEYHWKCHNFTGQLGPCQLGNELATHTLLRGSP